MPQFRQATLKDAAALLDLTLRAYQPIRDLGINYAAAHADVELVENNISEHMCFVMEEEGRLLSTVTLRMPWGPQPGPTNVPHIWWFATEPDVKQRGIGSQMIGWCEEQMVRDTLKAPAVTLGIADRHPWLGPMYQRRGYQEIGRKDLGRGHVTIFMRKVLRPERMT